MAIDTSIRISKRTRARLKKLGFFDESWDDMLNRVAGFYEDNYEEEDDYENDTEGDTEEEA